MTATNQDAEMFSGDTTTVEITVTDGDGKDVDLSGSDLEFVIVDKDGTTQVSKTKSGGGISVSGSNNEIAEVQLDPTDTADLQDTYLIELQETDVDGNVATLTRGQLWIREDLIK